MRRIASALAVALLIAVAAAPAQGAPSWHDGLIAKSYITNCASIIFGNPYTEEGAWAWVGSYNDLNHPWKVGDIFYAHTVVGAVGNACAGQYASTEVLLPQSTQFAISAQAPVYCFLALPNQAAKRDTVDCPAQPKQGTYGAQFDPTTQNNPAWPLPQGATVEIQFPIQAKAPLNGIDSSGTCPQCLGGATWMLDGNSSPWLFPHTGVYVVANPASISYPNPSASSIGANTAHTRGYLASHFAKGTVYTDIGTTTSYGTSMSDAIDDRFDTWQVDRDWSGLAPSTTYHWRLRFVPQSGTPVNGPDQTFTTAAGAPPPTGSGPSGSGGTGSNPGDGSMPGGGTPDPTTTSMPTPPTDTSTTPPTGGSSDTTTTPPSTSGGSTNTVTPPLTPSNNNQPPPLSPGTALKGASVPKTIKLKTALKKGVAATVVNAFDGTVDDVTLIYTTGPARTLAEARAKTKIVGHVVKKRQKRGKVKITVKLTKAGQKLLKGKRSAKLAVLVKASSAGHTPSSKTVKVTLKR